MLFATLEDFITGTFPIIGLKQFRDIAQSDRACYQAITDAPMKIVDFHAGGLLGEYVVNLGGLASEPIRQDLGLPPGPIARSCPRGSATTSGSTPASSSGTPRADDARATRDGGGPHVPADREPSRRRGRIR